MHFGSATLVQTATPGPKTTKSNTKKKLGIGSPVFSSSHYTGLFKDMGKTEVRGKGGRGALAHYDYKSLDLVSAIDR